MSTLTDRISARMDKSSDSRLKECEEILEEVSRMERALAGEDGDEPRAYQLGRVDIHVMMHPHGDDGAVQLHALAIHNGSVRWKTKREIYGKPTLREAQLAIEELCIEARAYLSVLVHEA